MSLIENMKKIILSLVLFSVFPTFGKVAGADFQSLELDGADLLPLMQGKADKLPRDELFWRINGSKGCAALRKGDWKYYRSAKYNTEFLFNLSSDPAEQTNLIDVNPEKTLEMKKRLAAWESEMQEPLYWWSNELYEQYKTAGTPLPQ